MKWLRLAKNDQVTVDELPISFNQEFHDYVMYVPWNPGEYITHIGDYTVGFGARYLILRALEQVKTDMGPVIDKNMIRTSPVPKLDNPIVRRLGEAKYPDGPIEEKIEDQRKRYLSRNTNPAGWEIADGDENISKEVNRREENFEVSHA